MTDMQASMARQAAQLERVIREQQEALEATRQEEVERLMYAHRTQRSDSSEEGFVEVESEGGGDSEFGDPRAMEAMLRGSLAREADRLHSHLSSDEVLDEIRRNSLRGDPAATEHLTGRGPAPALADDGLRVLDDEDPELQAALKASLESYTSELVPSTASTNSAPASASAPARVPAPVVTMDDDDDAEYYSIEDSDEEENGIVEEAEEEEEEEEDEDVVIPPVAQKPLDMDEIRRKRMERFGGGR